MFKKKRKAKEKKMQILHHQQSQWRICLCVLLTFSPGNHTWKIPLAPNPSSAKLSLGSPCLADGLSPLLSPAPAPTRGEFGRDGKDPGPSHPHQGFPCSPQGTAADFLGGEGGQGEGEVLVPTLPAKNRQQPHGAGTVPVPKLQCDSRGRGKIKSGF